MFTVVVSGAIGSGKSSLVSYLRGKGASYLSLDEVSRYLLINNEDMKAEIVDAFGSNILDQEGAIIPAQLAYLAFATPDAVQVLNDITFPYIRQRVAELICEPFCTPLSASPVRVVEVPLLTEAPDLADLADEVIIVTAPWDLRMERLCERGLDYDDAVARDALQASDEERFLLADTIITNDGSQEDFHAKLDEWWQQRQADGWKPLRGIESQE